MAVVSVAYEVLKSAGVAWVGRASAFFSYMVLRFCLRCQNLRLGEPAVYPLLGEGPKAFSLRRCLMRPSSTGIESRKKTLYGISICSSQLSRRSRENLHSNYSYGKASSLQSTGCVQARKSCESATSLRDRVVVGVSTSEWSVDISSAASITTACR